MVEAEQTGVTVSYDEAKDKAKIEFTLPIQAKSFTKISNEIHGVTFKDELILSIDIIPHEAKHHISQFELKIRHDVTHFQCKLEPKACDVLLV